MQKKIQQFKDNNPFLSVMLIAVTVRLLAIVFMPGYGSNLDKQNNSLTTSFINLIYNHLSVKLSTKTLMALSRCFYALVSMFTVAIAYRITDLLSNKKTALIMGSLAAISCIMPSFGVIYNVSAFVGMPFFLYGTLVVLRQEVLRGAKHDTELHRSSFLIAGFSLGLGVCLWQQSGFLVIGILVALLSRQNRKGCLLTLTGTAIAIGIAIALIFAFASNPQQFLML